MILTRLPHKNLCSFAQTKTFQVKLYKPNFEKYFDMDITKVEKQMKDIARKYSIGHKNIQKLFRFKPEIFIANSQSRRQIDQKIKFLNKLEETQPIARILNDLLFDSKHLLLKMSQSDIITFINHLKEFGFDKIAASNVFGCSSNLIHNNFDINYKEKKSIFTDYLNLTQAQSLDIFIQQPFLLTCSTNKLRESVVYFIERQNQVLTRQKTLELLRQLGEIFLMGREELILLNRWIRSWGLGQRDLWKVVVDHPLLLLNHPGEIFHYKAKMLRQFRFTQPMGKMLFKKYPSALICSVRALESKFLVARDRLKIRLNENNLEYLTFKFGANIRPRAEMLIRGKVPFTSEDIVSYLSCSEKQFLQKTGIPSEKYYQQKNKFPLTSELDFPGKKCLKNYPSSQKIFELSKRYYPESDLTVNKK